MPTENNCGDGSHLSLSVDHVIVPHTWDDIVHNSRCQCTISGEAITDARIYKERNRFYICQHRLDGDPAPDLLGYPYSWIVEREEGRTLDQDLRFFSVRNLRLLIDQEPLTSENLHQTISRLNTAVLQGEPSEVPTEASTEQPKIYAKPIDISKNIKVKNGRKRKVLQVSVKRLKNGTKFFYKSQLIGNWAININSSLKRIDILGTSIQLIESFEGVHTEKHIPFGPENFFGNFNWIFLSPSLIKGFSITISTPLSRDTINAYLTNLEIAARHFYQEHIQDITLNMNIWKEVKK